MTIMTIGEPTRGNEVSVAEAKSRLSAILERVRGGERVVVSRRGTPVAAIVPLGDVPEARPTPLGLAAFAGALAEWEDFDEVMQDVVSSRRIARDRSVPEL